ncbi:MAG: ATP-dependent RNA helicase DeaD [Pseudohongiellaceae bacterium]|jgi:ATP-dependent RNA helicase DeaD
MTILDTPSFADLALSSDVLKVLHEVGYETPSPIQAKMIPLMLEGRDVVGQAQTGTGKTAAFALPILTKLDMKQKDPQVLVLAPTRELAIQVAEAFQRYAAHLKDFHVLPVYGGQDYSGQIRALKRGVHVVVGTPGRVMDHMRRGTLKLNQLTTLVLDEADEMLRMGFIDDVEWILEQTPPTRQIALFSATMPTQVRKIANQYLKNPIEVTVEMKTATAPSIRQRFWPVSGMHKLDALTRILEAEDFDGMIVFVRTRVITIELAEKLSARGFAATALNGDIPQAQRERTIDQLKKGKLDILVATDVAARGLDVERISHVINYDVPHDTEAYIHRIGRTGRAGRAGDAILFIAPRERRMLSAIERATNQKIEMMELPSTDLINDKRIQQFKKSITDKLASEDLGVFAELIKQYQADTNIPIEDIAAALASLVQGDSPLLLSHKPVPKSKTSWESNTREDTHSKGKRGKREGGNERPRPPRRDGPPQAGSERYRIEVGHIHKVMPGNIVGAIANETGIDSKDIGRISIFDAHSTVDLPKDMPADVFQILKKVWVGGQALSISRFDESAGSKGNEGDSRGSSRPPIKPARKREPEFADNPIKKKPRKAKPAKSKDAKAGAPKKSKPPKKRAPKV